MGFLSECRKNHFCIVENLEGPGNGPVLWEGPLLGSRHLGSGPSCAADSTLLARALYPQGCFLFSTCVPCVHQSSSCYSAMLKSHHSPGVRAMSKPILLTTNEIGEGIRTTRQELGSRVLPDCRVSLERMEPQPSASARPLPRGLAPNHQLYPIASASSPTIHACFQSGHSLWLFLPPYL